MRYLLFFVALFLFQNCSPELEGLDSKTLEYLLSNGITAIPKNDNNTSIKVSMARQKDIKTDKWVLLNGFKDYIVELDLANASFREESAVMVNQMKNLEVLNLKDTGISDPFISKLSSLKKLKNIDLRGTKVSADQIALLMDQVEGLEVISQLEDNVAKLSPPIIEAQQEIFNDKVEVKCLSATKNVKIYYTLDGSEPTEQSSLYSNPITLDKSVLFKAVAVKIEGQLGKVASKQFIQTAVKVKKISVLQAPSEKYKAQGAQSLIDFKKGGSNFSTQYWLGYQGDHLTAVMELEQAQKIKGVYANTLQDQNNWIHHAAGLSVWGATNKRDYKLIKEVSFPKSSVEQEIEAKFFKVNFDPIEVKFVKVQVHSQLKNPSWHMSAGEPCWVFVDEIVIE